MTYRRFAWRHCDPIGITELDDFADGGICAGYRRKCGSHLTPADSPWLCANLSLRDADLADSEPRYAG